MDLVAPNSKQGWGKNVRQLSQLHRENRESGPKFPVRENSQNTARQFFFFTQSQVTVSSSRLQNLREILEFFKVSLAYEIVAVFKNVYREVFSPIGKVEKHRETVDLVHCLRVIEPLSSSGSRRAFCTSTTSSCRNVFLERIDLVIN